MLRFAFLAAVLMPVALATADHHEGDHHADDHVIDHVSSDHDVEHAGADHGAHDDTPPLLQFDMGSAICNLAIFAGVFAILAKFVWPPILEGLKAREQKIHGDLVAAEKANADARSMLADYQTKLDEASTTVQAMLADARKDAEASKDRIVAEAKAEADRQRERALADIETAKKSALADLADQTAGMAVGIASQVVGREIRPEDHQELIRSSLDRLPSRN